MAINTEMVELKKEVRSPEKIAEWMDPTLKGDTKTFEELRNMAPDVRAIEYPIYLLIYILITVSMTPIFFTE